MEIGNNLTAAIIFVCVVLPIMVGILILPRDTSPSHCEIELNWTVEKLNHENYRARTCENLIRNYYCVCPNVTYADKLKEKK